jgi:type VI secretion system secreted protein Hcp
MTEHLTSRRTLLGGALSASTVGAMFATASSAEAVPTSPTSSFFLAISGIQGESTDAKHPKTIEVLDWTFGVDNAISPTNTGSGAGKSKPRDFTFVARSSIASPLLFIKAATGAHLTTATLYARRNGEQTWDYLKLRFDNLYVTSYVVAPDPINAVPLDVVHLEYAKVQFTWVPQTPAGGPGTPITKGFDFINNVAF